jgi:hypothetical protein
MANQGQPPPPLAPAFSLTPAYNQRVALNYNERRDAQVYYKGCEALEGDVYNGKGLPEFLARISNKANQFEWGEILTINGRNFLTNYADIAATDVRQHALAYQGQNDRRAQNSNMLYHCLSKSISTDIHTKVTTNAARYNLPIPTGPDPNDPVEQRYDGVCFLKAIIDETYTNTLNNAAVARSNLTTLATYMKTLPDSSITEFNAYVKRNTQELAAANETTHDLLVNLFNGYRECKDKRFRDWITRIEDDWLFRRLQLTNDGLALLELTENYYKDHVMRSLWMKLDEDQETIIALKAQLKQQRQPKQQGKSTKNSKQKARTDAWKLQPPKKGEPQKKTVTINGKDYIYHWCNHHRKWTIHHPKDCMLVNKDKDNKSKNTGKEKKEKSTDKEEPTLKVMAAALKEIEEADSDSSLFTSS